jgi:hypothetical protein
MTTYLLSWRRKDGSCGNETFASQAGALKVARSIDYVARVVRLPSRAVWCFREGVELEGEDAINVSDEIDARPCL